MRTKRISTGNGSVTGSTGSAKASRPASRCLPGSSARCGGLPATKRRCQQRDEQYGADRQIAPRAVEFLEARLAGYHKLNITKRRACIYAAQLLSRYDLKNGARLPQRAFSSGETGRWIQEGLIESGLAVCLDLNSWKPTHGDIRNAKARAFVPCLDFLWSDTGPDVVSTFANYYSGRFDTRDSLHNCPHPLVLCGSSGVDIPEIVATALLKGTGLRCDFNALRAHLMCLPEETRSRKLCAAFASVGRVECDELHPIWTQHGWGRLYASKPALVNMPKVLLPALRDVGGSQLWEVDFSSYELRIAAKITGQKLPEGDAYEAMADGAGISRQRVKDAINPMLHGQRLEQCWYSKEPNSTLGKDRPLVEREMARLLPNLVAGMDHLRNNDSLLQQEGARIFFSCMGAAMEQCGISSAGLPKHDGWVFGGTQAQAQAVRDIFEHESARLTGSHFPVKCGPIS